jgi:hypothetical protein
MKAKDYRKYFATSKKDTDKLRDLEFIGCYQKDSNEEIIKKGFFELYHGEKESEIGFINSSVQIAEDGQAIYEFLQNAVDANASEFFIFYNEKYFLVINNGEKFQKKDIKSILNFSQSTKESSSSTIGKFGVGFKLIHRLVGESNGLKEIERYCGPILLSWDNNYLDDFLNGDTSQIDSHWLFKILYTNFPCGVSEIVKGVNCEKIMPFSQDELGRMVGFIKTSLNGNRVDLKKGSLFFLELGKGKHKLLENEENTIKHGVSHSINFIRAIQKNTQLNRVVMNNTEVICDENMAVISGEHYIFMYPKFIKGALTFFRKPKQEKISFFKYFPMESQNNNVNFMIHSEDFDIQLNRRELNKTTNLELLESIATDLIKKFEKIKNQDEEHYRTILVNLYLSDLKTAGGSDFIQANLTSYLWSYIKSRIPIVDFGFVSDVNNVKIIRSSLDVKLKKYKKFFNFESNRTIIEEAISKLNLKEWNILDALRYDELEDWVKTLSSEDYAKFIGEIDFARNLNNGESTSLNSESVRAISEKKIFKFDDGEFKSIFEIEKFNKFFYKGFFPAEIEEILANKFGFKFTTINVFKFQNLKRFIKKPEMNSAYFIDEYNCDEIRIVLNSIFKHFEIKNFAIRQKENKYTIDSNANHIYIEDKKFKNFLETKFIWKSEEVFIPDVFEKDILDFLKLAPHDEKIKKTFIDNNDYREIIDFIIDDKRELQRYFLEKHLFLNLLNKPYLKNDYEHKVISLLLQDSDDFIRWFKDKILLDNKKLTASLISDSVSFKNGKISLKKINHQKYKHHFNADVGQILDSFDETTAKKLETFVFNFQEESKSNLYDEIRSYLLRFDGRINDKDKLKFIIFFSLEKNENLLKKDFKGGFLFWDNVNKREDLENSFKLVGEIIDKNKNHPEFISIFNATDFFPQHFNQEYYLLNTDVVIEKEKLPKFFQREENKKYTAIYQKLGLVINESLPVIRQKIINSEKLKWDEIKELSQQQIINTLEFISNKNDEYSIDDSNVDFQNLKTLFKSLDSDYFKTLNFLPILFDKNSFKIKKPLRWIYITSEKLNSKNNYFQSRLSEEIKSKEIIYFNLLGLDSMPFSGCHLIEENDEENKNDTADFIAREKESINAVTSKSSAYDEDKALIGRKGELYVYEVLINKYGAENVIWNNAYGESKDIDIQLSIKDKIHYIEVKATIESVNFGNDLGFFMSSNQFQKATTYNKDFHLIFVVGINDAEPKLLYFNFNDEWLDSF